jgi:hypothetical protein
MFFRLGSQSGPAVPPLQQVHQAVAAQLQQHQQRWAALLQQDPAAFAALEPEIHHCFAQFADQFAASLLAHAAGQPALPQAAQKK